MGVGGEGEGVGQMWVSELGRVGVGRIEWVGLIN